MGESLERLRSRREAARQSRMPEWVGQAWRGFERGERLLGLGLGTADPLWLADLNDDQFDSIAFMLCLMILFYFMSLCAGWSGA